METMKGSYIGMQDIVKRSFAPTSKTYVTPSGTGRPLRYGDKIFVRLTSGYSAYKTLAEFTLSDVNDMSEVYGELRKHTRGQNGLAQLYVRNVTRGWSMRQPFKLYADRIRVASSATHPIIQPECRDARVRRQIPESVRLRYSM